MSQEITQDEILKLLDAAVNTSIQGGVITLDSARYAGKQVIIQIRGTTWTGAVDQRMIGFIRGYQDVMDTISSGVHGQGRSTDSKRIYGVKVSEGSSILSADFESSIGILDSLPEQDRLMGLIFICVAYLGSEIVRAWLESKKITMQSDKDKTLIAADEAKHKATMESIARIVEKCAPRAEVPVRSLIHAMDKEDQIRGPFTAEEYVKREKLKDVYPREKRSKRSVTNVDGKFIIAALVFSEEDGDEYPATYLLKTDVDSESNFSAKILLSEEDFKKVQSESASYSASERSANLHLNVTHFDDRIKEVLVIGSGEPRAGSVAPGAFPLFNQR